MKGTQNRRTRTYHLHSIERVLRGDRCASETLQGVCISKGSWIAAWNVRATYLTTISAKKKKKEIERLRFAQNRHQMARNSVILKMASLDNFKPISISEI